MTDTGPTDPRVTIAAGLLEAQGTLSPDLTTADITQRLRDLVTPSALWRATNDGGQLPDAAGRPPRWVPPTMVRSAALTASIEAAWGTVVDERPSSDEPVLRLTVDGIADADQVAALGHAGTVRLVPSVETRAMRFAWRWPVRVAVAEGPSAEAWVDELRTGPFAGELYDVRVEPVGHTTADDVDILLLDAAIGVAPEEVVTPFQAGCVIVVGDGTGGDQLLERAMQVATTVAVGLPAAGVQWFAPVLEALAHDLPVDVAVSRIVPGARIAADTGLASLTAVGRWAHEVGGRLDRGPDTPTVDLVALVANTGFDHESQGARQVVAATRALEDAGVDTALDVRVARAAAAPAPPPPMAAAEPPPMAAAEPPPMAAAEPPPMAAAEPPPMAVAPPPPGPPPGGPAPDSPVGASKPRGRSRAVPSRPRRRPRARSARGPSPARELLAEVTRDGELCAKALVPDADHVLEVRIAVPSGPSERGVPFVEAAVPVAAGVADLVVDVSSDDGTVHGISPLSLPTLDRTRPSTVATVPFRTGAEGSLLRLRITVLHQGRPIQAAELVASVRAVPSRRDGIELLPLLLTSDPEPAEATTSADVSVDATSSTLRRQGIEDPPSVDLSHGEQILDLLEGQASLVLGNEEAPGDLGDAKALELLITLARRGAQLHDLLADLDLDDAATIAVLVRYDSRVIPFELAYDGPAPEPTAKLCDHAKHPPARGERGCTRMTAHRVCPYAFWGVSKVIARTIQRRPVRRRSTPGPRPGPLTLRPVLYAAAARADANSPPDALPSDLLERALDQLVGPGQVTRVTSWRAWKGAVRRSQPQMLVVLGHTEIDRAEATIEIGRRSRLAQPSVTASVLGRAKDPAPVVVLLACASAVTGDPFGALPATFTDKGAAAVIATLTKLKGQHGAAAAAAVVGALRTAAPAEGTTLGAALSEARRGLLADGLIVGLLLVAHGEIDLRVTG